MAEPETDDPLSKVIKESEQRIMLKLDAVLEEVKKCVRRVDQLQKTSDLIYEDRNILEDMQASITALREGIHVNQQHQERVARDVKAEVIERGLEVKEKVENVEKKVEQKVDQVADTTNTILNGIAKEAKKNGGSVKRNFLIDFIKKFQKQRG
jgi:hypothetical protein